MDRNVFIGDLVVFECGASSIDSEGFGLFIKTYPKEIARVVGVYPGENMVRLRFEDPEVHAAYIAACKIDREWKVWTGWLRRAEPLDIVKGRARKISN